MNVLSPQIAPSLPDDQRDGSDSGAEEHRLAHRMTFVTSLSLPLMVFPVAVPPTFSYNSVKQSLRHLESSGEECDVRTSLQVLWPA
jgi:hypothetical protein